MERNGDVKMNILKTIAKAILGVLLFYVLAIVAIPGVFITGAFVGLFGNVVIYAIAAIAVAFVIIKIATRH